VCRLTAHNYHEDYVKFEDNAWDRLNVLTGEEEPAVIKEMIHEEKGPEGMGIVIRKNSLKDRGINSSSNSKSSGSNGQNSPNYTKLAFKRSSNNIKINTNSQYD
jgi:hypothetical protein